MKLAMLKFRMLKITSKSWNDSNNKEKSDE